MNADVISREIQEMEVPLKAVVLVSGGLDSATVVAIARQQGFAIHAVSFDYGQRHRFELEAAAKVCRSMGVHDHVVCRVDTNIFRGSALTNDIPVPHNRNETEMSVGIPVTYVPARNTVFLSIALGLAESVGVNDIFIGVNAVDYSGYPDCRPEFIAAFQEVARLGTRAGVEGEAAVRIRTPLIALTKAGIIALGRSLGVDYAGTTSCYDPAPDGGACGHCDACQLRARGFAELGIADPTRYAAGAR